MEQDPRNENFNSYENNSQPYRPTVIIGERNPDRIGKSVLPYH